MAGDGELRRFLQARAATSRLSADTVRRGGGVRAWAAAGTYLLAAACGYLRGVFAYSDGVIDTYDRAIGGICYEDRGIAQSEIFDADFTADIQDTGTAPSRLTRIIKILAGLSREIP